MTLFGVLQVFFYVWISVRRERQRKNSTQRMSTFAESDVGYGNGATAAESALKKHTAVDNAGEIEGEDHGGSESEPIFLKVYYRAFVFTFCVGIFAILLVISLLV